MKTYARIEGSVVAEIIQPMIFTRYVTSVIQQKDADGNDIDVEQTVPTEVEATLDERFRPEIAATMVDITDHPEVQVGWGCVDGVFSAPPSNSPSPESIRKTYEDAAQGVLDTFAKSWGYDSLLSAASYSASTVSKFRAEAAALIAWRDSLWQAAYAIEVSVQGGAPMPATAEDFLAELPSPPTRPTA